MYDLLPIIIKENVMFYPWIGRNYLSGGIFNKKILVLGESCYCGEQCECCSPGEINTCNDRTISIVKKQISSEGKKHGIFTKLTKLFLNKQTFTAEEKRQFWDSIVYYNYIQTALTQARESPKHGQWIDSEEPFRIVVDALAPDFILILGERLWENMPGKAGTDWPEGPQIEIGEKIERTWYYRSIRKTILSLVIYHPSSSSFTYDYIPIISKAIELS